jgi:hypothetical protein
MVLAKPFPAIGLTIKIHFSFNSGLIIFASIKTILGFERIYLTPFLISPKGRAERLEIAQWAILAKEPACREGPSPVGEGREKGVFGLKIVPIKIR